MSARVVLKSSLDEFGGQKSCIYATLPLSKYGNSLNGVGFKGGG